jgi:hypothetical protein
VVARIGTEGDPKTGLTAVVGIVGALALVLIIVGLQALFYHVEDDIYSEIYAEPNLDVRMVRAQQLEVLNSYGWVDREKGVVRIPIDRAMEMVIADPSGGGAAPGEGIARTP